MCASVVLDGARGKISSRVVVDGGVFTLYTTPVSPPVYIPPSSVSIPLGTNPTLDSADFRGHRLTYLEKVYKIK